MLHRELGELAAVTEEQRARHHDERLRLLAGHGREGPLELVGTRTSRACSCSPSAWAAAWSLCTKGVDGSVAMPEDGHAGERGDGLLEELQPFPTEFGLHDGQPRDVPPGPRQAGDEAAPTGSPLTTMTMGIVVVACWAARIADRPVDHEDIHLEPDQLGRERGEPLSLPVGIAVLQDDGLALDVAEVAQPVPEGLDAGRVPRAEPGMSSPSRGTCAAGCAWDASGAASRLRMSVTMHPTALYHMVVSSRQPHADLLLSMEAERYLDILQECLNISPADISVEGSQSAVAPGGATHCKRLRHYEPAASVWL